MERDFNEVEFGELAGGQAADLFNFELRRVIKNIADVNTSATEKREIVLKVKIKPGKERQFGNVEISCNSNLAGLKPAETVFHFDQNGRKVYESKMSQGELFDGMGKVHELNTDGGE